MERTRQTIKGERTKVEIVYAPKEKLQLDTLVQRPPQFNSKYLFTVLTDSSEFSPKVGRFIEEIQQGTLLPQEMTFYYRQQIQEQMNTPDVIDLNLLAAERWQEAIMLPCAILTGKISHQPEQSVHSD